MGTNYDWTLPGIPDKHIGKLVTVPGDGPSGTANEFIWAADPVQTLYMLTVEPRAFHVIDEYGRRRSCHRMLGIIMSCVRQRYDSVGQEFS